jgi:hypothetical protein
MNTNTQRLLLTILVLQILILANQWFGGPISPARAQIPDMGAQQQEIIAQLKGENDQLQGIDDKLDKLVALFQSGKLQVELTKPDDNQQK